MIIVYAKCVVTGQNREAFLELAGKLVEETRKEPGNLSYRLVQSRESQNIYAFVEDGSLTVKFNKKRLQVA